VRWLDLQVLRYANDNGIDSLGNHKLDVFTRRGNSSVRGYKYKAPAENASARGRIRQVTPKYKMLPGWNETRTA